MKRFVSAAVLAAALVVPVAGVATQPVAAAPIASQSGAGLDACGVGGFLAGFGLVTADPVMGAAGLLLMASGCQGAL